MNKKELKSLIKDLIEEALNSNFDNTELLNRDVDSTDYSSEEKKYILSIIKNWYENFGDDGQVEELYYYVNDKIKENPRREFNMLSDWEDTFDQYDISDILQDYKRFVQSNLLDDGANNE